MVGGEGQRVLTLQIPHATVHSSVVDEPWLAWHSIPVSVSLGWLGEATWKGCLGTFHVHRSIMWFRQMAQLSTTMSQAQRATAFHLTLSIQRSFSCVSVVKYLLDFKLLLVASVL